MIDMAAFAGGTSPVCPCLDRGDSTGVVYGWPHEADDPFAVAQGILVGVLLGLTCWFGIYVLVIV